VVGVSSVLALVVFHVALFWSQAGDGRLLDPELAVRWAAGFGLTGLLVVLRRAGVPLLWGRRALIVWVLVALLHWNTSPVADAAVPGGFPAQVLFELPSAAAGALLLAGGLLLALLAARSRLLRPRPVALVHASRAPRQDSPILSLHLASRAPPLRLA
jgi:hypothetical protein